jgi:hypothetical protein
VEAGLARQRRFGSGEEKSTPIGVNQDRGVRQLTACL